MRARWLALALAFVAVSCGPTTAVPGNVAPDITVFNGFGMPTSLSSMKPNVVILDFWATWCGPCRQTMPAVQGLYDKYRRKGLTVMGISNEKRETVNKFLEQNPYTYPFFIDRDGSALAAFDAKTVPVLAIIDRTGRVVSIERGAPLNVEKIEADITKALGDDANAESQ